MHWLSPNFHFFNKDFFSEPNFNPQVFSLFTGIVTFHDNGNIFCLCLGRRSQPLWRKFLLVCYKPKIFFSSSFSSGSCMSNVCCNEKVALSMVFPICNTDKVLSLRPICCYWFGQDITEVLLSHCEGFSSSPEIRIPHEEKCHRTILSSFHFDEAHPFQNCHLWQYLHTSSSFLFKMCLNDYLSAENPILTLLAIISVSRANVVC